MRSLHTGGGTADAALSRRGHHHRPTRSPACVRYRASSKQQHPQPTTPPSSSTTTPITPITKFEPSRRELTLAALTLSLISPWLAPQPSDAATEISDKEIANSIQGLSSVVPALTVREYMGRIRGVRARAFGEMRNLVDSGKYNSISFSLSIDPFDTIQQCSFFLPWALLRQGAAVPAQKCYDAYLQLSSDVKVFERLSIRAGRNQADEEEVLEGLDRVERSLDQLLETVPEV